MQARQVEWEAIHRRLADVAADIAGASIRDLEVVGHVLETRRRAAAKQPVQPDAGEQLDVLAFSLGGETYGVETCHVREVCRLVDLTTVPCTPPFIAGVINLRGQILAVVDLRKFFELLSAGLTELNRVIVLTGGDGELGLLVDAIHGAHLVAVADLQEGLPTLTGIRERFLKGITSEMLAVLDGGRLLADAGLKVDEQVAR
jgi:purine-binding chemotaxis protein CheW